MDKMSEVKKTVGKDTYSISYLSPREILKVEAKMMRVIGGAAGGAFAKYLPKGQDLKNLQPDKDGKPIGLMDLKIDQGTILAEAIGQLCERLDEDDAEYVVEKLLSVVSCDGVSQQNLSLDGLHFQGKPAHLLRVVVASMEVNMGDFLDEFQGAQDFMAGAVDTIKGSQTSTGGSGDQSSDESQP